MTQSALKRNPAGRFTDTHFIWTPRSYGQFALFVGKESPYILSKFNSLNTDNFYAPSVSVLTGFDSSDFQELEGGGGGGERRGVGPQQSCPLTFEFVHTGLILEKNNLQTAQE